MTIHLLKLAVGMDSIAHLARVQNARREARAAAGGPDLLMSRTRRCPRRAEELVAGGSIYWVIRRQVLARQRLLGFQPLNEEDGRVACGMVLDPEIVPTLPRPQRPFQGWRYMKPEAAPADAGDPGNPRELPPALTAELRSLGIL